MDPIFLFPSPGGLGTFSGLVKLSYFAYNIVWLYLPVMLDDLLLNIKSEVRNRSRKKTQFVRTDPRVKSSLLIASITRVMIMGSLSSVVACECFT